MALVRIINWFKIINTWEKQNPEKKKAKNFTEQYVER